MLNNPHREKVANVAAFAVIGPMLAATPALEVALLVLILTEKPLLVYNSPLAGRLGNRRVAGGQSATQ